MDRWEVQLSVLGIGLAGLDHGAVRDVDPDPGVVRGVHPQRMSVALDRWEVHVPGR